MKTYISSILFIFLLFILFIFFEFNLNKGSIPFDYEQEDLNKQIIIYFSHVVAENTPKGLAAQKFANLVESKTEGKVKVEVFPNGMLYAEREEVDALMRGEIQMIAPAYSNMTDMIPEWLILDLPYIFKDYQHVEAVLNGEIGSALLKKLEKYGIKGMAFWGNGFKQMTSNRKPLKEPADFYGQRFRIMPSKALEDQFRTLGVITEAMPFNQVYQNLENKKLDGQENTISNIYSKKFYQVQRYLTISNHGYLGYSVMMNEKFWNSLPSGIQQQIQEAMEETTAWSFVHAQEINQKQFDLIKSTSHIEIYELNEEERNAWIQYFDPLYSEYKERYGEKWINKIQSLEK